MRAQPKVTVHLDPRECGQLLYGDVTAAVKDVVGNVTIINGRLCADLNIRGKLHFISTDGNLEPIGIYGNDIEVRAAAIDVAHPGSFDIAGTGHIKVTGDIDCGVGSIAGKNLHVSCRDLKCGHILEGADIRATGTVRMEGSFGIDGTSASAKKRTRVVANTVIAPSIDSCAEVFARHSVNVGSVTGGARVFAGKNIEAHAIGVKVGHGTNTEGRSYVYAGQSILCQHVYNADVAAESRLIVMKYSENGTLILGGGGVDTPLVRGLLVTEKDNKTHVAHMPYLPFLPGKHYIQAKGGDTSVVLKQLFADAYRALDGAEIDITEQHMKRPVLKPSF